LTAVERLSLGVRRADAPSVRTRRIQAGLLAVIAAGSVLASACSGGEATGGLGVQDAGAQQACAGVQQLAATASGGAMKARELRSALGQIYAAAQSSGNTLIKTRALALYADATVMATGGQAPSLRDDLQAMHQACAGQE
jgi:hypothetical protein